MDQSQMQANLDKMAKMFEEKMAEFQADLNQASTSRKNPNSIAALNTEFLNFKTFVYNGLTVLRAEMEALHNRVDRIEMRFRRKMLLVHGIPEQQNEDTCAVVVSTLSTKCKIHSLSASSIAASYRLGKQVPRNTNPRPIVVKFSDATVRTALWKSKVALKGTKVTLSEFLTKSRHDVFVAARLKFGVTNCWTLDGTIHVKTPDGRRHRLETMTEFLAISPSTAENKM